MSNFNINNPMAPPWLMYPEICNGSLGWRMGSGEYYIEEFIKWFKALSLEEQQLYKEMFPTPKGWMGWYNDDSSEKDIYGGNYLLWNTEGKPKYSIKWLQGRYNKGEKIKYLFFWGHQPSPNGSITKACFSQWWESDFIIGSVKYCCMEQYMMAEKARLFDDNEMLEKILKSNQPKQIKAFGREVKNFSEDIWQKRRHTIVVKGNYAKFMQNSKLKLFLLDTKNRVLVEASPVDRICGIGMASDNKEIENPMTWNGKNMLGFVLMEVRDEIQHVCKNEYKLNMGLLHNEFD